MRCSRCDKDHEGRTCKQERDRLRYVAKRSLRIQQATENGRVRKAKLRQASNEAKDRPCADCGVRYDPWVMQFDHLDADSKVADVAKLVVRKVKMSTLLAEIAKCEVVCANCHAHRTYTRQQKDKS